MDWRISQIQPEEKREVVDDVEALSSRFSRYNPIQNCVVKVIPSQVYVSAF